MVVSVTLDHKLHGEILYIHLFSLNILFLGFLKLRYVLIPIRDLLPFVMRLLHHF